MYEHLKKTILNISRLIWERHLSDTAGGNISVREKNIMCITPRLMGFRLRWQIGADDISVVGLDGEVLEGPAEISREGLMHLGLYNAFGDAGAVIHAHPYWTNVFVAKGRPVMPALETTDKFGVIECIEEAHGYSKELAEKVVSHFQSKRDQWEKTALEVILPRHGIVALGKDINHCFDIVDRIESDCRCQLLGKLLDL